MNVFIDIETYSSDDIGATGVYKYSEAEDFDILLIGVALETGPAIVYDVSCKSVEEYPSELTSLLNNSANTIWAHNATFERICLRAKGIDIPIGRWRDTMTLALYNGLPASLAQLSKVLNLKDAKLSEGKALIKLFSCPNKEGQRSYSHEHPLQWQDFIRYNEVDVLAEREIFFRLQKHYMPYKEWLNYANDQVINDTGVGVDIKFVRNAISYAEQEKKALSDITVEGLTNNNSTKQLSEWYSSVYGKKVKENLTENDKRLLTNADLKRLFVPDAQPMTKPAIEMLTSLESVQAIPELYRVLSARLETGAIAYKKYDAILQSACSDDRLHGMFKFYGASRTGRWSGAIVQPHNMAKPDFDNIDERRECIKNGDFDTYRELSGGKSISSIGKLIRTAFVPRSGYKYVIADYSAIEARVISWFADEKWRLDVFRSHGKIYEAAASRMFNVPIESIDKHSPLRARGKVAELALGYGGGVSALDRMGGARMGLSNDEMDKIVKSWREANQGIVSLWNETFSALKRALMFKADTTFKNLSFGVTDDYAFVQLPSGRRLKYWGAKLNRLGTINYMGQGMQAPWAEQQLYGGKLVENIVQATARDILAFLIDKVLSMGLQIVLHVHDEIVVETNKDPNEVLSDVLKVMKTTPDWGNGIPLVGDGFVSNYYTK